MPGLSSDIVQYRLPLNPECSSVKQKLRRMRPETSLQIKEEIKKQFDAGFLAVARYPEWVANIVPVPKKDGKVRMRVDYWDLNRASPKDNFPLLHIDVHSPMRSDLVRPCPLGFQLGNWRVEERPDVYATSIM